MDNLEDTKRLLRQIMLTQSFAVLATSNNQQPYSNLVAFAVSDDLRYIIFATDKNTQKYRNILSNDRVALLIDNRSNSQSDLTNALAITIIGVADESGSGQSEILVKSYLDWHPSLVTFIKKPNIALIGIKVTDYIIARFDTVERLQVDSTF